MTTLADALEALKLSGLFEPRHAPAVPAPKVTRLGQGAIRPLSSPGSFVVTCCGHHMMRVEGAAETFMSYHLRHAWGGLFQHCPTCQTVYALAGDLTTGNGLPTLADVSSEDRIDWSRTERLTETETTLLDVALERDDALWERSAEAIRRARAAGDDEEATRLHVEAILLRGGLYRRKLHEVRVLARARGLSEFPVGTRLYRLPDGGGVIEWPDTKESTCERRLPPVRGRDPRGLPAPGGDPHAR